MAHREMRRSRVLVAAAGLFLGLAVVGLRVAWLQLIRHPHYAGRAEEHQEQRVPLQPLRGNLLDRRGRVLARDQLAYSISAAPREMKSPRATARDLARLLDLDPRRLERSFEARPRFLWVARRVPPPVGQQIAALHTRGVYVSPEYQRVYPLGPVAAEIVGRTNLDNLGIEGLELQLDPVLRGQPGWATLFRDGRGRAHSLSRGLRRPPSDGGSVVLTIDADLQAILESHLAAAVDTLKALRGFATFLDPRTGEVLAAVTVPHVGSGGARNRNFTDTFEPGSTFKVVAAAAALEEDLARPSQVFEASASGVALVAPGTRFRDVRPEARYTFADAIRRSSNIVFARIGLQLGPERLYRYATALGFGGITGVEFPGEAGGKLRHPERWSARSAPAIAIGHEISVTPLQLALAYAAIANGGVLMRPLLVREIRDSSGEVTRRFAPAASHRVLGPQTCATLREMLQAVVDSGTAKAARVPGLAVAGKTGTAQKYDAAVRTYGKGLYLSSFAGFAPADIPHLVGVIVIDEPRGRRYYGGEVAAPVFRRVLVDLLGLPSGPLQGASPQVAARPPDPAPVVVPDLRLLPPREVERTLLGLGLRRRFHGQGPRALAQQPPAGAAVGRGARVEVWLSPPEDSTGTRLPDLAGFTVREALRELTRRQVAVRIVGKGTVVSQDPAPGTPLPLERPCVLRCEPGLAASVVIPGTAPTRTPGGAAALAGAHP